MKILKESRAEITKVTVRGRPSPSGVTFGRGFGFSFNIIGHMFGQRPQPGRDPRYILLATMHQARWMRPHSGSRCCLRCSVVSSG
jgi:hypothetical protein